MAAAGYVNERILHSGCRKQHMRQGCGDREWLRVKFMCAPDVADAPSGFRRTSPPFAFGPLDSCPAGRCTAPGGGGWSCRPLALGLRQFSHGPDGVRLLDFTVLECGNCVSIIVYGRGGNCCQIIYLTLPVCCVFSWLFRFAGPNSPLPTACLAVVLALRL